jgi:hypothetical protein
VSQNNDIFDDLLRSALADTEGAVSPGDWDAISSKLDAIDNRKIPIGWWLLAGVLVIGLGIGIFKVSFDQNDTNNSQLTQETETTVEDFTTTPDSKTIEKQVVIADNQIEEILESTEKAGDTKIAKITQRQIPIPAATITSEQSPEEQFKFVFEPIELNLRSVPHLSDLMITPTNMAIFYASFIDADKFNRIPTHNNGKQKAPVTPSNKGSWELGFSASPALASKLIKPNGKFGGLLNRNYDGIISTDERNGRSYQIGLNLNRHINDWLFFSIGAQYNQLGELMDYDFLVDEIPVEGPQNNSLVYLPLLPGQKPERVQYKGNNNYHYVEIPVKMGIVVPVLNNRFELRTEVGVQFAYLVTTSGKKIDPTYLKLGELDANIGYNRKNLGGVVTAGLYYASGNNVEWGLTPYYQMTLTSIRSSNSVIQERPYNYGLNLRLNYKLINKKQ